MRLLLCHRFFWPDTPPYASLLRAIASEWAARGHDVTVFTSQPSYKLNIDNPSMPETQKIDGFQIRRVGLPLLRRDGVLPKILCNFVYCMRLLAHIVFGRRNDVVMVSTFPPILLAASAAIACRIRRCDFIYHCQDLHPEVSVLSKPGKSIIQSLLLRIDTWSCNFAAAVVVLSEDMASTLRARRGLRGDNVHILNNFELPVFEDPGDRQPDNLADFADDRDFRVIFAGNLGRFQGLESLISAAALMPPEANIGFYLVGEGVAKSSLIEQAGRLGCQNVTFLGQQSVAGARQLIGQSDLGVVSLNRGLYRVAYPSKTLSYLACGCPVVVVVEPDSQLAHDILSREFGYIAKPADPNGLANAILAAFNSRIEWSSQRQRIAAAIESSNGMSNSLQRWCDLLDGMAFGGVLR